MTCYQMRVLLPSFENDELSEEERATVYLHLATCAHCRSALESIRTLHRQLSLLQTISVNAEITDNVISRIKRITDIGDREADPGPFDLSSSTLEKHRGETDSLPEEARGRERPDSGLDRLQERWAGSGEP